MKPGAASAAPARTRSQFAAQNPVRCAVGKTKNRIVIPVGGPLREALDARRPEKPEGTILRNTFGEPWTSDGFKTSWGKAVVRAKLGAEDLHFHDLRGTAVTRLASCPLYRPGDCGHHRPQPARRRCDP
jgi:integrase